MKTQTLITILIISLPFLMFGQRKEIKFGEISKDELLMEYYEPDSSANAVVLYDKGEIMARGSFTFERHIIIKILKSEGKKYATIQIPLLQAGNISTNLLSFKAVTYNYENEKIVETRTKFKDLITEKTFPQFLTTMKGAFPAVKKGSIIEIQYSVSSNNYSIPDWYFQYDDIPVKYSEFSVSLPEFVKQNVEEKGFADINTHYSKTDYQALKEVFYNWYAKNIPAFKREEYLTTTNDYKKKVEFELSYLNWGGIVYYDRSSSWQEIDKDLNESFYFGEKIRKSLFLNKITDSLITEDKSDYEKMLKIYNYVQQSLEWTGYNTQYSYRSYREVFKKKIGNSSGEINLALICMLKHAGINSTPVLLSTRDNGKIFPINPTIDKFNYVVTKVKIDDEYFYLDATEKLLPAGLLPKRCFNGQARILKIAKGELFDVKPKAGDKYFAMYFLELDKNEIFGSVKKTYKDYSAYNKRKEIEKVGNVEDYSKKIIEETSKVNIKEYRIEQFDDIYKPIKESYKISTSDHITFAGNMIYLSPLLDEVITDNPFKLEERKYPVDFAYPILKKLIMQYTIPEGYGIAEIPKSLNMTLPGKAANYQFQVSQAGNMMQVISIFKVNQTVFHYDTYKDLQNFYNLVIQKQNEKIVLKKLSHE